MSMTTDEIRNLHGSEFLNELSGFFHNMTVEDISAEGMTKELIIWLDEQGYCLALKSNIAMMMGRA